MEEKNLENKELNNNENAKEHKREMKVKVWVLIIIFIVFVILGLVFENRIMRDGCEDSSNIQDINNANIQNTNTTINDIINNGKRFLDGGDSIDFKPIIYLYPQKETELSVKLGKPENLTCSYPKYENGWNVIAKPDGTLIDTDTGRGLYALYWEGINTRKAEIKEGFVVKREDTIKFLEEKLEILGLNERESEEFIVYWLPKLQENEYNYIRFASMEEINEDMPLEFSVEPDTLIRVLMEFKGLDEYIEVSEQKLETPSRDGFVVVEWGGTELK